MDKDQLEQILRDISKTENPQILEGIASMMEEKTDKSRRRTIEKHKRDGLTPIESLRILKKDIAWAGSKAMGFAADGAGKGSALDKYIEEEAQETFRRAKKDIEEIYGVSFKKKREKRK